MKKILLPSIVLLFSLSAKAQEMAAALEHNSTKGMTTSPFDTIKNKKEKT